MLLRIPILAAAAAAALAAAPAEGASLVVASARPSDADGEACEAMQTSLLQTGVAVAPRARISRGSDGAAVLYSDVSSAAAAGKLPGDNEYGPYAAVMERVFAGGYDGCGWTDPGGIRAGHQDAEVWYPVAAEGGEEPGPVPVISFSHGFMLGGHGIAGNGVAVSHGTIVSFLTSWGYVVVLHTSEEMEYIWHHDSFPVRRRRSVSTLQAQDGSRGEQTGSSEEEGGQPADDRQLPPGVPAPRGAVICADATYDQIRSLEWIRGSQFANRIDWDRPTGVAGFSQGGGATVRTAMNASAVAEFNIGAAFAWMPYEIAQLDARSPLVPIFLAAGELDTVSGTEGIQQFYEEIVTDVPRSHAMVAGLDHNDAMRDEPFHRFAVGMFDCHLRGHSDACALVYGDAPEALCNSQELTICEHANGPAS